MLIMTYINKLREFLWSSGQYLQTYNYHHYSHPCCSPMVSGFDSGSSSMGLSAGWGHCPPPPPPTPVYK